MESFRFLVGDRTATAEICFCRFARQWWFEERYFKSCDSQNIFVRLRIAQSGWCMFFFKNDVINGSYGPGLDQPTETAGNLPVGRDKNELNDS